VIADPKRILVISPHTDDAEVSSGGTISRFLREGKSVHVIVLATAFAETAELPRHECERALKVLGVPEDNIMVGRFPVRRIADHRQDVLDVFIEQKRIIKPDLVIIPSLNDIHQDHQIAAQEGLRAFKNHASIICFTYPWNLLAFNATCFIEFNEDDLEKKIAAVSCYKSQDKPYMKPEIIRAWALTSGIAVNARYAESFEVARWVI
jgi:LmbE family N-acetylglucosaminyl deacetylase